LGAIAGFVSSLNPIVVAAIVVVAVVVVATVSKNKNKTKSKTKYLTDVAKQSPSIGKYQLAYVKDGHVETVGDKLTFVQALSVLGITGASNSLKKIYNFTYVNVSSKYKSIINKNMLWGIKADSQAAAKTLAIVFGCSVNPEIHGDGSDGYVAHYHDKSHKFHIWY
jgi:hypothetical protein